MYGLKKIYIATLKHNFFAVFIVIFANLRVRIDVALIFWPKRILTKFIVIYDHDSMDWVWTGAHLKKTNIQAIFME